MKTRSSRLAVSSLLLIALVGCSPVGGSGTLDEGDKKEAAFLERMFGTDIASKQKPEVTAGSEVTTVVFYHSVSPAAQEGYREQMKGIKEQLGRVSGREPNTLRFVFDNVTLEE